MNKNQNRFTKKLLLAIVYCFGLGTYLCGQSDQLQILNKSIEILVGEHKNPGIAYFESIEDVCQSEYVTCNKRNQIIGLDFQFANLNGRIPASISELKNLEYINLEYNYLSGEIPEGLEDLRKLEQLSLAGNFLSGRIPATFEKLSKKVWIDLAQNSFQTNNRKLVKKLNIRNQINVDECRSPDSIFLEISIDDTILDAVKPGNATPDSISLYSLPRFPGCEDQNLSEEEKASCAQNQLLQFIYKNLIYPAKAREKGIEGMAVIRFVVLKSGEIGYAELLKDPGGELGNAGLWVVNRMNYICDRWTPGMSNDGEVDVLYTIPIRFKLE